MPNKKIVAVLGGAFDPLHNDHLRMAGECLNYALADEVWLIPSPDRWDKKTYASADHRYAMVAGALSENLLIKAVDFEMKRGEFRGSYVLLNALKKEYPDNEFRLVVGGDTYPTIPMWRDSKSFNGENYNGHLLLKEFSLILFPRNNSEIPDNEAHTLKGYMPLHIVRSECVSSISSTLVRERGKAIKELVPEFVAAYIQRYKLFEKKS